MPNEISTLVEHIFRIKKRFGRFLRVFLIISNFPVPLRHPVVAQLLCLYRFCCQVKSSTRRSEIEGNPLFRPSRVWVLFILFPF
jgi:hypothetical protein